MRPLLYLVFGTTLFVGACGSSETAMDPAELDLPVPPGFILEPAQDIGPDPFTPPFDADDDTICDKEEFLSELEGNPEASTQWLRVLDYVPRDELAAYVTTLVPARLEESAPVLNYGLREDHAYPRRTLLAPGTAVLMDPNRLLGPEEIVGAREEPGEPTPGEDPADDAPPAPGVPVTRCRSGNPLLPPEEEREIPPPGEELDNTPESEMPDPAPPPE